MNKIKFKNHILICGWNNSARRILGFLNNQQSTIIPDIALINELDEGVISTLQNHYANLKLGFIKGDFTNINMMNNANVSKARYTILLYDESKPDSAPSDERTIIAAHNIADIKLRGRISIQLKDEKYLPNIRKDKIQNVVIFDKLGGNMLANSTLNPSIPDFIQEILDDKEGKGIREMEIPLDFVNRTYLELANKLKEDSNTLLLGIVSLTPEVSIDKLVSEDTSSIDKFIKQQFELSGKKLESKKSRSNIKIKPADDYVIQDTDKAIVL